MLLKGKGDYRHEEIKIIARLGLKIPKRRKKDKKLAETQVKTKTDGSSHMRIG